MDAPQAQGPPRTHSWGSLPPAVLSRCLRTGPRADDLAAFATCTCFMRAMLTAAPKSQVIVQVDDVTTGLSSLLQRIAAWDVTVTVLFVSDRSQPGGLPPRARHGMPEPLPSSLQPLLRMLQQKGVRLPRVAKVTCVGVLLDACAPAGLEAVFPNLQHFEAKQCHMRPGVLPLSACSNIQSLVLSRQYYPAVPFSSYDDAWSAQQLQLAGLPSLSSLSLDVFAYPTSFLPLWAGQLTDLQLRNDRFFSMYGRPDQDRWQSALTHAAQCGNLSSLTLGECTAEDVAKVSVLTQLQDLRLSAASRADPEKLISTLLSFPRLTRLTAINLPAPQQSFADHACSWKQLSLQYATPLLLSRLPLHSLTLPLQLEGLTLDIHASSGDSKSRCDEAAAIAHAAAANVARSHQPIVSYSTSGRTLGALLITFPVPQHDDNNSPAQQDASTATLLRALAPLVPSGTTALYLTGGSWDAALITTLQQVTPPATVTTVMLQACIIKPSVWRQLALSFPQLKQLHIQCSSFPPDYGTLVKPSAMALMGYFSAAAEHSAVVNGHTGKPRAARVEIGLGAPPIAVGDRSEYIHSLQELQEQLVFQGYPGPNIVLIDG